MSTMFPYRARRSKGNLAVLIVYFLALHLGPAVVGQNLDPTGTRDSTAAIQRILDAPGSIVFIPKGTYLIGSTSPLFLPSHKIVKGQGRRSTILKSSNGISFPIAKWSYEGSIPPYILTITTTKPVLGTLKTFYCPPIGMTCPLTTIYGLFPSSTDFYGAAGIPVGVYISSERPGSGYQGTWSCSVNGGKYSKKATCSATVSYRGLHFKITDPGSYTVPPTDISYASTGGTYAAGYPALAVPSAVLRLGSCKNCIHPTFPVQAQRSALTFTVGSSVRPTASSGTGGTFFIPTNAIQAYDTRSHLSSGAPNPDFNKGAHNTEIRDLTITGDCSYRSCKGTSYGNYLLALRGPSISTSASNIDVVDVDFTNYSNVAIDAGYSANVSFSYDNFTDIGTTVINANCPDNLHVNSAKFAGIGWNLDSRMNPAGMADALSTGGVSNCVLGKGNINFVNSTFAPFDSTDAGVPPSYANYDSLLQPFMFGVYNPADSGSPTRSIINGVEFAHNTMIWRNSQGGGLISAFADGMNIHDSRIVGNFPKDVPCGFIEVAGSNLDIYNVTGGCVGFSPGARATPNTFSNITIHNLKVDAHLFSSGNTFNFISFSGFQQKFVNPDGCSISDVHVYDNEATFRYTAGSSDGIAAFGIGSGEGGPSTCAYVNFTFDHNRVEILGATARQSSSLPNAMFVIMGGYEHNGLSNQTIHLKNNSDSGATQHIRVMPPTIGLIRKTAFSDMKVYGDTTSASSLLTQEKSEDCSVRLDSSLKSGPRSAVMGQKQNYPAATSKAYNITCLPL
ncbi:MAG: hypothetical protein HIU93_01655 [Acidobacteria bacterium]|nr:hypothetical protein [Acidobacteriota bacterium]